MSTVALQKAAEWNEALMNAEFRGRGDKEYLARYRLSQKTGIKENYLFRLKYKLDDMKDVAGEVYRRLKLAHDELCARNEAKADAMRAERMRLRNEDEADQEHHQTGGRMVATQARTEKEAEE